MKILVRILVFAAPILILVVLGFGGAQMIAGLKPPPEQKEEVAKGLAVFAERARIIDLELDVSTQGEVRPKREISVAPQIAGRISFVAPNFQEGGFIRKGQVLVRLEQADYELTIVSARVGVASAEQRLAREQAEARLAIQDLESLDISDASPLARREPQLAEAQASLEAAKAQLAEAELGLQRTEIRSPFDGRVRMLNVNIGQYVGPGTSLGQIFGTDVVEISLPLNDNELGRLGLSLAFEETRDVPGPAVVFSTNVAGQQRRWNGRITRTAASVDPRTRLISAIAEVNDPYGAGADNGTPLAPGLFVDARIEGRRLEGIIAIPREALRLADTVYVFDDATGKLAIRNVGVIHSDADGAYIMSGIAPGELVITSPMQSAFDGQTLTLANPDAASKAAAASTAETVAETTGDTTETAQESEE